MREETALPETAGGKSELPDIPLPDNSREKNGMPAEENHSNAKALPVDGKPFSGNKARQASSESSARMR